MGLLKFFNDDWKALSSEDKKVYLSKKFHNQQFKIIYIDDEQDHLDLFLEECAYLGLDCFATLDCKVALEEIKNNSRNIYLVVSDFNMPEIDGFEFRKEMLKITNDIPFVVLTGFMSQEMALKGVDLGISAFLEKPYKSQALLDILINKVEPRLVQLIDDWEMLKGFTDDATSLTEKIESLCMELDEGSSSPSNKISMIFGMVHTIKGSSGFFDPKTLHNCAHVFEDSIKKAQLDPHIINSDLVSAWLKANDQLKKLIKDLSDHSYSDYSIEEFKKLFHISSGVQHNSNVKSHSNAPIEAKVLEEKELKVAMSLLDGFMQSSGELTVIRNIINRSVKNLEALYPSDKDVVALTELLEEMHKINSDVQNKISDIRCVSVKHISKPLIRAVRDTANALGKNVEFVVEGEDLRLDNSIIEIFSQSLIHMIRNSLDHGIESSPDRIKANKNEKGLITLRFEIKDGKVQVTLKDDGRGISLEKIKQKAISQGLKTAKEIETMSISDQYLLIFESGLSTAETVTEFSGRGVGMSMVRDKIFESGGDIKIISEKNKGSEFVMTVPIPTSVLISNCLFVRVGEMVLAIPQNSILRVLDLSLSDRHKIQHIEGGDTLRFEGQLLTVTSFADFIKIEKMYENYILILQFKKKKFAIKVSEVLDIEDIVIKNLPLFSVNKDKIFQGATFLPDARVGLVVSIEGLFAKLNIVNEKQIDEKQDVEKEKFKLLIFKLNSNSYYGIKESEILRIERIDCKNLQTSSGVGVIPYRDGILSLINLTDVLETNEEFKVEMDQRIVVVISNQADTKNYCGLVINEIVDLDDVVAEVLPVLSRQTGVSGNVIYKNSTLLLVNTFEIIEYIQTDSNSSDKLLNKLAA